MIVDTLVGHRDVRMVVADPPWCYQDNERPKGGSEKHYPSMSLEEICDLGQAGIGGKDCFLVLWVTNAFLANGRGATVCQAWGFQPRTIHTWVKIAKNGNQRIGAGDYGRNSTEHFIIAKRGRPDLSRWCAAPAIPTAHMWPWQSRHSRKPEPFYQLMERVCPGGPFLEMFATQDREGPWRTWGLGVEATV